MLHVLLPHRLPVVVGVQQAYQLKGALFDCQIPVTKEAGLICLVLILYGSMTAVGPATPPATISTMADHEDEDKTASNDVEVVAEETPEEDEQRDASSEEAEVNDSTSTLPEEDLAPNTRGLKVLFLSSDTGGGHRASAESLGNQFQILFPGATYELLDIASEAYPAPYNSIVSYYKHLSAHPSQWNVLYKFTNAKAMERVVDTNIKVMTMMCERALRKKLRVYDADVVVSVHPLMTHVPIQSCAKISHETGKHLPMFTVVTDLGSAHATWFANGVERMFVGSPQIYKLAQERGKVPEEKLRLVGLPIRHDFAVQSEALGDRWSEQGQAYQKEIRTKLELPVVDRKTLLLMGGGEGVGSLSNIVNALYVELVKQSIDALILVVCGRNEKLKKSLATRDWGLVLQQKEHQSSSKSKSSATSKMFSMYNQISACGETPVTVAGCIEGGMVSSSLRRILSTGNLGTTSALVVPSPTVSPTKDEEKKLMDQISLRHNSIGAIAYHDGDDEEEEEEESERTEQSKAAEEAPVGQPNEETAMVVSAAPSIDTKASIVSNDTKSSTEEVHPMSTPGKVSVVGLGFVTNMAEYMVAADVLISKAGPGTISEAAALGLPVLLTSFLPGQEEGNVDFVVDGNFGSFCSDSDPSAVAEEAASWLVDDEKLKTLSVKAREKGAPYAARDIVQEIGDSTLRWRTLNDAHAAQQAEAKKVKEEAEERFSPKVSAKKSVKSSFTSFSAAL